MADIQKQGVNTAVGTVPFKWTVGTEAPTAISRGGRYKPLKEFILDMLPISDTTWIDIDFSRDGQSAGEGHAIVIASMEALKYEMAKQAEIPYRLDYSVGDPKCQILKVKKRHATKEEIEAVKNGSEADVP